MHCFWYAAVRHMNTWFLTDWLRTKNFNQFTNA